MIRFPAIPDPAIAREEFDLRIKETLELLEGLRGDGSLKAVLAKDSKPKLVGAILLNGWANYGTGHADAGFYVFNDGRVMLRGVVMPPSTFISHMFSVGRDFAPAHDIVFTTSTVSGAIVTVTVKHTTGDVHCGGAPTTAVYLDGFSYVRPI